MVSAGACLSILLDVSALRAVAVVVIELLEVGRVDPELPELRRFDLLDRGAYLSSRLVQSGTYLPFTTPSR